MEDKKLLEKIGQVLKKSHGEPSKFIELITCILDLNQEGEIASYPKIVRRLWPEEWSQAKDKVDFEIAKWNLLCRRRREINERVFNSHMCFNFFIELSQQKQFQIISDPKEIYSKRIEELERHLARVKSKTIKEKIKAPIIELSDKFKDFKKREVEELADEGVIEVRERPKPKRWYKAAVGIVAVLVIVAAGVAIWNLYFRPVPPPAELELPDKPSIAVLPFVNMSGDPEKEYFSDGITEELINTFARLEGLRVISRTSAFFFKDKNLDIKTIGERLKVDAVLEGSVRAEGNKLRIAAQFIKVADDSHLWAGTYDREMKDLCSIQEEVSRAIVDKLKPRLLDKRDRLLAKDCPEDIEAYKLYLKGRFFWNKMSHEKAVEYFEQALALDPNYALAYAGLADAYNRMAFFFSESVEEYYLKAKAAVMKALEIDDMLSEAYAALGHLKLHYEWDWKGAERALKRAIELNPGNALAHGYYASYLKAVGRMDEALAEIKIALELDPLSRSINAYFGQILVFDRQLDKAIKQLRKTLELYPNHPQASMFLGNAYVDKGNYQDGIALLEKAVSLTRRKAPIALGNLGYAYGVAGEREKAQEILDEVLERSKQGPFAPDPMAGIYTGLGDKDKAFEWLEKSYEVHHPTLHPLKTIPKFRSLHSDPRFTALLKKMGLEE